MENLHNDIVKRLWNLQIYRNSSHILKWKLISEDVLTNFLDKGEMEDVSNNTIVFRWRFLFPHYENGISQSQFENGLIQCLVY